MDAATLAQAKVDASRRYAGNHPNQLISVLRRNQADAYLGILGDSTGNETTEWFYLLTQWIGQQFPAYTIVYRLWNDTNQSYDAPTTIQAGTGTHTLFVYNASVPGMGYDYPIAAGFYPARLNAMLPSAMTMTILSYGYNSTSSSYRSLLIQTARAVRAYQPKSDLVLVSQAPKGTGDADATNHLLRQADTRALAAAEGWGLIDVTQAFLDYGNYTSDLIVSDGIHPNAAGSQLWFTVAKQSFTRQPLARPVAAGAKEVRRYFPASQFLTVSGTPDLTYNTTVGAHGWNLDPAAVEAIGATFDIPSDWPSVNVYLVWTCAATTGSVKFTQRYGRLLVVKTANASSSGVNPPTASFPQQTIAASGAANSVRCSQFVTASDLGAGRPYSFTLTREATDAADTISTDVTIYGLIVERAE